MDASILAKFPDDDHVLGPFLGNLPPDVLDEVVKRLGWFKTTFALAGKTCRELVEPVRTVPSEKCWIVKYTTHYYEGFGESLRSPSLEWREKISYADWRESSYLFFTAAMEEDIEALDWLVELFISMDMYSSSYKGVAFLNCWAELKRAAQEGLPEMKQWAKENGCEWDWVRKGSFNPTEGCHLNVLKFLHEKKWIGESFLLEPYSWRAAAEGGHLEVLKYAHKNGCPVVAMHGGHLEVWKYLHENGCPWDETCMYVAARCHLEVVKYAHENGCPWHEETCSVAAEEGHLEVVKYAHENGCPWHEKTCDVAAEEGHLEVLKYAHENGCPLDEKICSFAAREGHLEVVKYLHENGYPLDEETCSFAAREGHLEVVKYLHENGYPLDEETCSFAAREGHLEVLKYPHENGCPLDEKTLDEWTCRCAAEGGHLEVFKYLHENGYPLDEMNARRAARSAQYEAGNLDLLKWLCENGCTMESLIEDSVIEDAVQNGHLDVLKWVHEESKWEFDDWEPKFYDSICEAAAKCGHLDVLKYAHENGCEWDWEKCLKAAQEGHVNMLDDEIDMEWANYEETYDGGEGWWRCVMRELLWIPCGIDSNLAPAEIDWEAGHAGYDEWAAGLAARNNLAHVDDAWDWEAFLNVTKEGEVEMKRWARKNGCPWSSTLCLEVARHIEVFQWLKVIGLQTGIETPVRRFPNDLRQSLQ